MKPQGIHPAEGRVELRVRPIASSTLPAQNELGRRRALPRLGEGRPHRRVDDGRGRPAGLPGDLACVASRRTSTRWWGATAMSVTMWDVVNEAIGDGDDDLLRDSVYSRTTGMDFIVTAFKAAQAKDPDALLIYNDYNGHKPGKREKLI